jgi:hypothetical protein
MRFTLRPQRFRFLCALAFVAACSTSSEVVAPDDAEVDAPRACRLPSDCPRGSHCGAERTCAYDCREDRDCQGIGARCDVAEGRCLAADAGVFDSPSPDVPPAIDSPPSPDAPPAQDALPAPDAPPEPDGSEPPGDYHVTGSMEGETTDGGGDELTLGAGLCVRLPLSPYQVTGYHHGDPVGGGRVHGGDDVNAGVGTRVYAVWNGQVVTARRISTWGTLVEIRHTAPDGTAFHSIYGHLREAGLAVRPGQMVRTGDLLGSIGARSENGGWAPHLHFAVFTGSYPATGVLKGHVLPSELPSYPDPVPFLERHGGGVGCGTTCVPGGACDPADPCFTGRVECTSGVSRCAVDVPRPAGTSCVGGRCDAAGRCVADPCMGETCNGHGVCSSGRCTCAPGYAGTRCERCADGLGDCDGNAMNGCETDLRASDTSCGACGRACSAGQRCASATCAVRCTDACPATGYNACLDARTTRSCDRGPDGCLAWVRTTPCGMGEGCTSGTCTSLCAAPRRMCGADCVDVTASDAHCGACFNACGAGGRCNAGRCDPICGEEGLPCCAGDACRSGTCRGGTCSRTPTETCNGVDDDGDGTVDNPLSCWRILYRFVNGAGARCIGATTSAPSACAGYAYEREAFVVAASAVPGSYALVQCSRMTDHILAEQGSPDAIALANMGYSCSGVLGYVFRSNPGRSPFGGGTCAIWRYRYSVGSSGAHLFTTGSDSVSSMTCEAPSRGWAGSTVPCFGASAPGC